MGKHNIFQNSLFQNPHEGSNITSPILRGVIDQVFNEINLDKLSQFKALTTEDKTILLKELTELRLSVIKAKSEGRFISIENLKNHLNIFSDKNIKADQEWETLKAQIDGQCSTKNLTFSDEVPTDFNSVSQLIESNKSEILTQIEKPLGSFGDTTINEILSKGFDLFSHLGDVAATINSDYIAYIPFLTTVLIYLGVVRFYNKVGFKNRNVPALERSREMKLFMLTSATFITAVLVGLKKVATPNQVKIKNEILINTKQDNIKDAVMNSGMLPFFNNKIPNWSYPFILAILLMFLESYLEDKGLIQNSTNAIISDNIVLFKYFLIFSSVISFLFICKYILTIYFYIMFSKGKMSMPIYLPQYMLNWLKAIEENSKEEHKGDYIEFYFNHMLIYLLILFLNLLFFYFSM